MITNILLTIIAACLICTAYSLISIANTLWDIYKAINKKVMKTKHDLKLIQLYCLSVIQVCLITAIMIAVTVTCCTTRTTNNPDKLPEKTKEQPLNTINHVETRPISDN